MENNSNSVVWAKLRYCPYWPAKIVDPPMELKEKLPARKFCVYFFGSKNYGFVSTENVTSYLQNRAKYIKRGRGKSFKEAVEECNNFLANGLSEVDESMNDGSEIVVKQELDFIVKEENLTTSDSFLCSREVVKAVPTGACINCHSKQMEIEELKSEKKELIEGLTSAKKDAQTYYLDLKKSERALIKAEKDYNALKNQIECLNKQNDVYCQQNQRLKSQMKKLQCNENDLYEVENIVGHEKNKYLVKWKGYANSENTWECEHNLNCPQILNKYKKKNNLL